MRSSVWPIRLPSGGPLLNSGGATILSQQTYATGTVGPAILAFYDSMVADGWQVICITLPANGGGAGVINAGVVALNTFLDPAIIYRSVYAEKHPVIVIENKTDYGKRIAQQAAKNFIYECNGDDFPVVCIRPAVSTPSLTILAYGGMADQVGALLEEIFAETDYKPELIIPSLISDLPIDLVVSSVSRSGRLLVIEEGSGFAGIGSELITTVTERCRQPFRAARIAAHPVPIPSVKSLENSILPDKDRILREIKTSFA